MQPWRLSRRPELDALRGVAVLLVVTAHALAPARIYAIGGAVGVAVFFALSGFLITALLLGELDASARIDLAAFYRRRAARLLPALVVMLTVLTLVGMVIEIGAPTPRETLAPLVYVQNFVAAGHEQYGGQPTVGHTWSLSVEEQFYLVFPVLLMALGRRFSRVRLTTVLAYLAVAGLGLRLAEHDWRQMYYGTVSNACLLLVGATAASWMTTRPMAGRRRLPVGPPTVGVVVLLVAVGAARITFDIYVSAPILAALLAVGLMVLFTWTPEVPSWCTPGWLTLVGRRSYGLYLWHYPLMYGVRDRLPGSPLVTCSLLAAAWLLTLLSWRLVERPAMGLLRRGSHRSGVPTGEPFPARTTMA